MLLMCLILLCAPGALLWGQFTVELKLLDAYWPDVVMSVGINCDGVPLRSVAKKDVRVLDDGVEIRDFTLLRQDPSVILPVSAALVLGRSTSAEILADVKAAALAFVRGMDGLLDEASVSAYSSAAVEIKDMTKNREELSSAIEAMTPASGAAVWDACYQGLMSLLNWGTNATRAVVLLCMGYDNASTRTISEIISLANRYRIRVITVGLGTGATMKDLQMISRETGGEFFPLQSSAELPQRYLDILDFMRDGFRECTIRYRLGCADGDEHNVRVAVDLPCGSDSSEARQYRLMRDPSTFRGAWLRVEHAMVQPGSEAPLPLSVDPSLERLPPGRYSLRYDSTLLRFVGLDATQCLFDGVPVALRDSAGTLELEVFANIAVRAPYVLGHVMFRAAAVQRDTVSEVLLHDVHFSSPCVSAVSIHGSMRIDDAEPPRISANRPLEFCDGESVVLSAPAGMRSYRWSSGENTRAIVVNRTGAYSVTTVDADGVVGVSRHVIVTSRPQLMVSVTPTRHVDVCYGKSITLEAEPGFATYRWNTGATGPRLVVDSTGTYSVTVTDDFGCTATSEPTNVWVNAPVRPKVTVKGSSNLCVGQRVTLEAEAGFQSYRWEHGPVTSSVQVSEAGTYRVQVVDRYGCEGWSDSITIRVSPLPATPSIERSGETVLCEGDTLWLTAVSAYSHRRWSDGATDLRRPVTTTGMYSVTVWNDEGCSAVSTVVDAVFRPRPGVPVITRVNERLHSTQGVRYQWYRNGMELPGETGPVHIPTESGMYQVRVYNADNCSNISEGMSVVDLDDVAAAGECTVAMYPTPAGDVVTLRIAAPAGAPMLLNVTDMLGREVLREDLPRVAGTMTHTLRITHLSAGLYLVHLRGNAAHWTGLLRKR